MTINSRNKGAQAEREVAKLLFDWLGVRLVRNLEQSRNGGYDLVPEPGSLLEPFAIEVKRYAKISTALLKSFWTQALSQASSQQIPVLFFRQDRDDWRVLVPIGVLNSALQGCSDFEQCVMLSAPLFCAVIRERAL